ncbi:MAG: GxxExxY protein [Caldilineaceae bacterium]
MTNLLHADLTYYLRGVGFQIQNAIGSGHTEADYEQALVYQLAADGVPFLRQPRYEVYYRDKRIGEYYPDLTLAGGALQVDLKATPAITKQHKAQMISYLAVTGAELGLVMNFGAASMQYERLPNFVEQRQRSASPSRPLAGLLYPELTTRVLTALHTVYFALGPGYLHQIYRRAVRIELAQVGLNFVYVKELPLRFAGQFLSTKATRLFWVEQKLLLAVLAVKQICPAHTGKVRWAMRELGCSLGLLANFYPTELDVRFLREHNNG